MGEGIILVIPAKAGIQATQIRQLLNDLRTAAASVVFGLIGKDGKVQYHGGAGPHLFDLDELDEALQKMEASIKVS